jgi:hypothetical protein
MQTKQVEWSYPSSPNATALGFPRGCWAVELCNESGETRAIAGFERKVDARAFALGTL